MSRESFLSTKKGSVLQLKRRMLLLLLIVFTSVSAVACRKSKVENLFWQSSQVGDYEGLQEQIEDRVEQKEQITKELQPEISEQQLAKKEQGADSKKEY